jgi:hypothetical protein
MSAASHHVIAWVLIQWSQLPKFIHAFYLIRVIPKEIHAHLGWVSSHFLGTVACMNSHKKASGLQLVNVYPPLQQISGRTWAVFVG